MIIRVMVLKALMEQRQRYQTLLPSPRCHMRLQLVQLSEELSHLHSVDWVADYSEELVVFVLAIYVL